MERQASTQTEEVEARAAKASTSATSEGASTGDTSSPFRTQMRFSGTFSMAGTPSPTSSTMTTSLAETSEEWEGSEIPSGSSDDNSLKLRSRGLLFPTWGEWADSDSMTTTFLAIADLVKCKWVHLATWGEDQAWVDFNRFNKVQEE